MISATIFPLLVAIPLLAASKSTNHGIQVSSQSAVSSDYETLIYTNAHIKFQQVNSSATTMLNLEAVSFSFERKELAIGFSQALVLIYFDGTDIKSMRATRIEVYFTRPPSKQTSLCTVSEWPDKNLISSGHYKCQNERTFLCREISSSSSNVIVLDLVIEELEYEIGGEKEKHKSKIFDGKPIVVCT